MSPSVSSSWRAHQVRKTYNQKGSLKRVHRHGGREVWIFRWREIGPDGIRRSRKVVVGTTKLFRSETAAWARVEELNLNINLDRSVDSPCPRTFGELVEHFSANELPEADNLDGDGRAFSTKDNYRSYLRRWIIPKWSGFALSEIKAVFVEKWLGELRIEPSKKFPEGKRAANGTKKKIRDLMHVIYQHAIRYEWVERNPISLVRQGGKREHVPDILEVDELAALLNALELRERIAVFVDFGTGARRGELQGFKWGDIDFAKAILYPKRSIVKQHVGKLKTEASDKPMPLSPLLIRDLLQWRQETPYANDADYVFASSVKKGKQPLWMAVMMRDHIQPIATKVVTGKHVTWHTLRRTYATLLQAHNDDPKVVQELLRHASAKVSMDVYAQAVTEKKRNAQTKVVELVAASQKSAAAEALAGGQKRASGSTE
jgi:integrase